MRDMGNRLSLKTQMFKFRPGFSDWLYLTYKTSILFEKLKLHCSGG